MKKYDISPEDRELFQKAVKDISPLKKSKKVKDQKVRAHKEKPYGIKRYQVDNLVPEDYELQDVAPKIYQETILSYASNSVTRNNFRQLKRGKIPIDATLDLHGEILETAKVELNNFLNKAKQYNYKCVLIIHGKGLHNPEGPVLKNYLNNVLKQIPSVIAFHSAQGVHGGSGAMYVLLQM